MHGSLQKYRFCRGGVVEVAPDLIKRSFKADRLNQKWNTDITEFHLFGRKMYLSPSLDMFNGEIISYSISEHPVLEQVMDMMDQAFEKIPDETDLIFHSDQGCQYQHRRYQKRLADKGILQSMSRKGNCLDNAIMDSYFVLLKSELLYLRKFDSYDEFRHKLELYIPYYNCQRIKGKLNGLSPVQYRIQIITA